MTEVHDEPAVAAPPGPAGPADPAGGPRPQLRRSRRHKTVGGVCGGLGQYFDVDPVIFRVVLAVTAVTGGIGLLAYGFGWLLVPQEGEEENEAKRLLTGRVDGPALIAVLLALVGCGMFLSMLHNGGVFGFSVMLLMAVGASAVWSRQRRAAASDEPGATQVADAAAPPETKAPPIQGAPSWWRDPIVKDGTTGPVPHGYLWGPFDGPAPVGGRPARRSGCGVRQRTRPRSFGGLTFLAALAACAAGTVATWQTHPLGSSLAIGLGCALGVFGVGLVLASFFGRVGAGTIFLGLLTAGLLTAAAAIPKDITTDWIRTDWRPTTVGAVHPNYQLGTGEGLLDLSKVPVPRGSTVTTGAEVGAGTLRVVVPAGVTVRIEMEVGLGDIDLPGENPDENYIRADQQQVHTLQPPSGAKPAGTVDLRLQVGVGQVEVARAAS